MYLKRLEIHGFKSFAQKTVMEFNSGIVAIVGPNGSGKSNVADALRWVLGEQSAKLMRGKKADDVIFAGSDKKIRLGFAEVAATFDNADRRIPVDAAEVSIGRRVDRSGNSEYLINGNVVRLMDIIDLVLKSNIGTSRYTVIGQGTIDQMILAGPSEVKNLLDEASGVKTYYIRRDKTLRRLEQTAQNLMRAEDLIAEIAPRLRSLRRQAKKMEARVEIEQELKILQRDFFGKTYWVLKEQIDEYAGKISHLAVKRNAVEQECQLLRGEAEKIEQQDGGQLGKYKEIREALEDLQKKKNNLLEELSLVRGKMQSQKTAVSGDAKTLQVELHTITTKIGEVKENIKKAEQEQEEAKQKISAQNSLLSGIKSKIEILYSQTQTPGQMDLSDFEKEFKELDQMVSEFYSKLESEKPWEEVNAVILALKKKFENFKTLVRETLLNPQNASVLQQQIKNLQREKEQIDGSLQGLNLSFSKSEIYLNFLQKDLADLEQKKLHLDLEFKKASSATPDDFWQQLIKEEDRLVKQVESLAGEIVSLEELFKKQQSEQNEQSKKLHQIEMHLRDSQDGLSRLKDEISALQIEKAKYDTQGEVVTEEIRRILGEEILQNIKTKKITSHAQDLENRIGRLKNQLDMIGGMDELTLKEYQETETRYTNLANQINDLKKSMADLRGIMDELDEHIKTKFNEAFHRINEKFEHYFRILFNGGRAILSLLKAEEKQEEIEIGENTSANGDQEQVQLRPEEKIVQKYEKGGTNVIGVDIKATPPGKKLSNIQSLSGGERSLTSIALLCSLLTCFPSPFVVLDEVDAALDDANTIRFGQILSTLSSQTQFLTITHNRETMAHADILYGVTMGDDGVSKLLSVKLDQAKAYAK
ncbi:MAG: chromosome segregation SMC family protein [Candidatus Doudnabacteria bacterium]|nr:chromosome segregation SMC family protein [Candidatus Doudnabacteria bacterium]